MLKVPENYGHLVLTRGPGDVAKITINGVDVFVEVHELRAGRARLGFHAPPEVTIIRHEVADRYPTPAA